MGDAEVRELARTMECVLEAPVVWIERCVEEPVRDAWSTRSRRVVPASPDPANDIALIDGQGMGIEFVVANQHLMDGTESPLVEREERDESQDPA
jgi:hypothetical protein